MKCFEWNSATRTFAVRSGFPKDLSAISPSIPSMSFPPSYPFVGMHTHSCVFLGILFVRMCARVCTCTWMCTNHSFIWYKGVILSSRRRWNSRYGSGRCGPRRAHWDICQHYKRWHSGACSACVWVCVVCGACVSIWECLIIILPYLLLPMRSQCCNKRKHAHGKGITPRWQYHQFAISPLSKGARKYYEPPQ